MEKFRKNPIFGKTAEKALFWGKPGFWPGKTPFFAIRREPQ
jgi:hypothetical protein